jgi:peptide deformylase
MWPVMPMRGMKEAPEVRRLPEYSVCQTTHRENAVTLAKSDRGWMAGSSGEGIVTLGDPRLKAPSATVADPSEVSDLLTEMVARLRALNGAGLAAPQIGAAIRVIVVEVRKTDVFPDRPTSPLLQMINPKVVDQSPIDVMGWEGCFSVPGLMGGVPRAQRITVQYMSLEGGVIEEQHSDYVARVIQHEIDHLDGVEFLNRMTSLASLTTVQNYVDYHRYDPDALCSASE